MSNAHPTPGPWFPRANTSGMWEVCVGPSDCDQSIAYTPGNKYIPITDGGEANARLIAAAPEMLEALKQALLYIESDETAHGRQFGDGNVVRAALAKAEGRD